MKAYKGETIMPLKLQMLNYLLNMYGSDANFSAEVAIYWFANDYHGGQASELYSILSTSPYKPSCLTSGIATEGDDLAQIMYEDLVCVYNV